MQATDASEPTDAAGRAYHLLGFASPAGRWRLLAELLVFAVAAGILMLGPMIALDVFGDSLGVTLDDDGLAEDPVWALAQGLVFIAMALPAVWVTVALVGRRPVGTLSSVAGRLRWRQLRAALLPAVVVAAAVVAFSLVYYGWDARLWPGWRTWLLAAGVAVGLTPLQAAAEEYVFRGWLLQGSVRLLRLRWVAAGLTSVLFAWLHLDPNLFDPWMALDTAWFGLVMCWLTFRSGGLEVAIGYHTVWNTVMFLAAASQGEILPPLDAPVAVDVPTAVVSTTATTAYAAWMVRRRGAIDAAGAPGDAAAGPTAPATTAPADAGT